MAGIGPSISQLFMDPLVVSQASGKRESETTRMKDTAMQMNYAVRPKRDQGPFMPGTRFLTLLFVAK